MMRMRILGGVVVTGLLCAGIFGLAEPPVGRPAAEVRNLVFLGATRPVLIRLHLTIDGQPFADRYRAAWDDYVRSLFAYLDRNGRGSLDEREAALLPPPHIVSAAGPNGQGAVNVAYNFGFLDANGDGKVSYQELADYYRHFDEGPFQMRNVPNPVRAAAERAGDVLFGLADTNKDGGLTRDKLTALVERLGRMDANDDEMVYAEKLAPAAPQQQPRTRTATARSGAVWFVVAPNDESAPLARELLARFGGKGEHVRPGFLSREALGIDQTTFDQLDTNKDGWLSAAELAHFANCPADVTLAVRLGARGKGETPLTLVRAAGPNLRTAALGDGRMVLDVNDVRIEISALADGCAPVVAENRTALLRRSQALASKQGGGIRKKDAGHDRQLLSLFDLMDRDGNGIVDEKEVGAYLDKLQDRQIPAVMSRVTLLVSDEGRGLFDLLDRDRDGRLSRRELQEAATMLADYGLDKGVARSDISRSYQITIGLGQFEPFADSMETLGLPISGWRTAPLWFRKMDRNRDGDVSPREFLGSPEQFRKLDANGDGLISIEEAIRAEESRKGPVR